MYLAKDPNPPPIKTIRYLSKQTSIDHLNVSYDG